MSNVARQGRNIVSFSVFIATNGALVHTLELFVVKFLMYEATYDFRCKVTLVLAPLISLVDCSSHRYENARTTTNTSE